MRTESDPATNVKEYSESTKKNFLGRNDYARSQQ
jgi:hypothetical protein